MCKQPITVNSVSPKWEKKNNPLNYWLDKQLFENNTTMSVLSWHFNTIFIFTNLKPFYLLVKPFKTIKTLTRQADSLNRLTKTAILRSKISKPGVEKSLVNIVDLCLTFHFCDNPERRQEVFMVRTKLETRLCSRFWFQNLTHL